MILKLYSLNYFINFFKKFIKLIQIINNEYFKVILYSHVNINLFLNILCNHIYFRYKILSDISCVDYISKLKRFEINYNLLSIDYNSRLMVSVECFKSDIVPSIIKIYLNSNWLEREMWDMYGIFISDHNDLRRILTDYGFDGYPLRKDFPVNGYVEVRYDESYQYLVYEPIELMQNIRYFSFSNPILNKKYIL